MVFNRKTYFKIIDYILIKYFKYFIYFFVDVTLIDFFYLEFFINLFYEFIFYQYCLLFMLIHFNFGCL
jgi:hypothetical protein